MSAGFPNRPSRSDFGPTYKNARPTRDPEKNATAETFNLLSFQAAGASGMCPLAWLCGDIVLGDVQLGAHAESWNPEGNLTGAYEPPSLIRMSTGVYEFEYASQVPNDEQNEEVLVPLVFKFGVPVVRGSTKGLGFCNMTSAVAGTITIVSVTIPGTLALADLDFALALY